MIPWRANSQITREVRHEGQQFHDDAASSQSTNRNSKMSTFEPVVRIPDTECLCAHPHDLEDIRMVDMAENSKG